MRIAYDIETNGLLTNETVDYTTFPYKLKPDYKIHCLVAQDIDTGDIYKFYQDTIKDIPSFFDGVTEVVGHNIINFDNLVLRLYFGMNFKVGYEGDDDNLNGRDITIHDTLVMSRLLNPDRKGGHSLKAWGKRTGVYKDDFGETTDWAEFSEEMLEYCVDDVKATVATYNALVKEWGNWDWLSGYNLEKKVADLTTYQEHFGFYFNSDLAKECLIELDQWLDEIQQKVEPHLPAKPISKTNAKKYIPPKVQFKKDGNPSSNLEKFIEKHGGEWLGKRKVSLFGKVYDLPLPKEPLVTEEPMTLANQIELKQWLVSAGWAPKVVNEKDLTLNTKKQKLTPEKFRESAMRYIEDTLGGAYEAIRCERLKCKPWELTNKILMHDLRRPLKVYTAPKFTINQDKDIDPGLLKMGEQYAFITDVVKWLTYRHRRNSILSPNDTGFLKHVRDDNRIPTPANPCGASTSRYQHSICCNIPRVTSLYGDKMRDMFRCYPTNYQVGYDFSGLEARIEAHYTKQFNGDDYATALISEKPNDIHTVNANKMGISRDEAKTLKYAISYGAQPPKVSKQMGWSLKKAQGVFDDFWKAADPLKVLKERVTGYWKKKGEKQFVKAIDGRKLWVRSEHSIINIVFQSAGVICAKKANVLHHKWLEERGLLFDPFADTSFKSKAHAQIHYHDECQWEVSKELVDKTVDEEGKEVYSSVVGGLASKAAKEAGDYYSLRVNLDADYEIGKSWKDCH